MSWRCSNRTVAHFPIAAVLICLFTSLLATAIGGTQYDQIHKPRLLFKTPGGALVGAENGLFFVGPGQTNISRVGGEESVNDIQSTNYGLLIATDSGLFLYRPENIQSVWQRVGTYEGSVRQIYHYSDLECFLATQDGVQYLAHGAMRRIGKNTEIERISGKLGDNIIALADTELGLINGEDASFVDCKSHITAAVPFGDGVAIATIDGLRVLRDGALRTVPGFLGVNDLELVGSRFLVADKSGLSWWDGAQSVSVLKSGECYSIEPFGAGFLVVGQDTLYRLGSDGLVLERLPAANVRTCWRSRTVGDRTVFCLNNGVLVSTETSKSEFKELGFGVRDAALLNNAVVLATDAGMLPLPRQTASWKIGAAVGGLTFAAAAVLLLWWRRGRLTIFISYRRSDSRDAAGRVRAELAKIFGGRRVLMDVHTIEPGHDFRSEIDRDISRSDIVLIFIGAMWLTLRNEKTQTLRLFAEKDYVRYEIESALKLRKPIIPVLLGDARQPKAADVPPSIADLTFLQPKPIRPDPDFDADFRQLVQAIRRRVRQSNSHHMTASQVNDTMIRAGDHGTLKRSPAEQ